MGQIKPLAYPLACTVVLCIHLNSTAVGAVLRVPEDYSSITSAISIAVDGDIISVAPGIYQESLAMGSRNITLESREGPIATTIQGSSGPVILLDGFFGQAPLRIRGFTITGGTGLFDFFYGQLGGGIFCNNGTNAIIEECMIVGNSAVGGLGGGIISVNHASPLLIDCVLANNTAEFGGGAATLDNGMMEINHCTITNNTATRSGGALAEQLYGDFRVENSILWGNTSPQLSGQFFSISHSDVEGGALGQGNIDADPQFVNGYHIAGTSPCLDTGNRRLALPTTPWDIEGNSRILNGDFDDTFLPDMGAYEFTNVRLSITGNPTAGGVITIDLMGTPNLNSLLFVGFQEGTFLVDYMGYLGFQIASPWGARPWPSAPSTVNVTLPSSIPPDRLFVFQVVSWNAPGRANTSNRQSVITR